MNSGSELSSQAGQAPAVISRLSQLRERYSELCSVLPLPDLRTEAWHYGRPDRFLPDGLEPAVDGEASARSVHLSAVLAESGPTVAIRFSSAGLDVLKGSPEDFGGVISLVGEDRSFSELPALSGWLAELAERETDRLEAEQISRLSRVLLVDLPEGATGNLPLHLVVDMPADGQARFEQIVVNAAPGSSGALHLHIVGDDHESKSLLHIGLHITVAEAASFDVVRYQNTGNGNDIRGIETQRVGRNARCRSTSLFIGGRHLRHDVSAVLEGEGSESILRGLYYMGGRQTASIFSHQDHRVPNAHSDLLFKGTMLDRAAASYLGQISVSKDAQGTDAYQSNRSLLLSPHARSSSSPQLEIEANDVRCSHGASVANVSDEELFYLETRGIDPETGRQLLISGFLAEIADLVPEGALREYVYEDMLRRRV